MDRIQKLEPSTDYETKVEGRKGSVYGSETVNFRTKDEVYGQMEGLGDPSLSKEEKKAKVLQLADSSTPDFSVLESPRRKVFW